jgi:signal transduction histidine kinase
VLSRVAIVPTCLALMFGGLILDVLTTQQFIAAIVWIIPIALSGLAFSRRFTFVLVVAAIVLNILVSWLNAGAQGGLDGIAVLNRLLLAATAVLVGVMTVNLSTFSTKVGQLQERESKMRQERDLERIAAAVAGSQTFTDAIEQVIPVLRRVLGASGALMVGEANNILVAPRVADDIDANTLALGMPCPIMLEDQITTITKLNDKPVLFVKIAHPSVLIAVLEPAMDASETLSRSLPVLTRALERVLMIEDLSTQRLLLERRNTVIRDLVYAFSHDLRTPLMANAMNMKLAIEGAFGDLPKDYLKSLENGLAANQDVLKLADELLLVARFESGESSPQTENINLLQTLEEMVARLLPIAKAKEVQFKLDLNPVFVHGNSLDLRRVLQNLLDNAIKFSPAKSTIEISLRNLAHKSNHIARIEVQDTGSGVPQDLEGRLFTRFSSPRAGGGSGLGLYLAKRIVEAHKGTIGYTRAEKTVFWVELLSFQDTLPAVQESELS